MLLNDILQANEHSRTFGRDQRILRQWFSPPGFQSSHEIVSPEPRKWLYIELRVKNTLTKPNKCKCTPLAPSSLFFTYSITYIEM